MVLRASGGASILKELSNEKIALDMEDALRLNVAALAVTAFIGGEYETQTVHNMTRLVDLGNRHGVPILAVTGFVDEAIMDAKYFRIACRLCAELGAHFVKTYFVEDDFDSVVSTCPVPIVVAGGNKVSALAGFDHDPSGHAGRRCRHGYGKEYFSIGSPAAMIEAVRAVVHGGETPKKALELYESLKNSAPAQQLSV